ncbi:Gfo/Idh/MocA family oxidoreductase [Halobacillus salinarum]|uniref:Inositol 2-dehydrogenase/D-chiro-inositol 3-dehydrogenase n=1 Tax=Halobacillus salinarum TaxID=2932257 RepID=A0ABY4EMD9_9BACI|nr:Gfo/Idh/MocA family oxidoreductase [Halobacillus salinarum]UOQ45555.1 Gfo/Idh/MocA family oxidoreductase [Halobacillus salinarum]
MIRVGVVGTGMIGQDHIHRITNVLKGAQVTAVNDVDEQRARQACAKEHLDAEVYESGIDLIQAPDVDAVIVTSWGPTHEEFVLAAIEADKPVFCEKPLAVTAEGCKRIVEAELQKEKQYVQVGYMRRYDKGYKALKKLVDEGQVGEPLVVHCAHRAPSAPNFSEDMPLTDSFPHEIDTLRWLLDDEFVSAQVVLPRKTSHSSIQDPHIILLETEKGTRIDAEIFVNCQYGYDIHCEIIGEQGIANLPEPASVLMRKQAKRTNEILVDWKERFLEAYDKEIQEWIDSVQAGKVTGPSAWDGYKVALTVEACVEAKSSREIIAVHKQEIPSLYAASDKLLKE